MCDYSGGRNSRLHREAFRGCGTSKKAAQCHPCSTQPWWKWVISNINSKNVREIRGCIENIEKLSKLYKYINQMNRVFFYSLGFVFPHKTPFICEKSSPDLTYKDTSGVCSIFIAGLCIWHKQYRTRAWLLWIFGGVQFCSVTRRLYIDPVQNQKGLSVEMSTQRVM